ncbi:NCS1 family nucleobase:cation symporter-1 [Trinickia caryophylli]|uniref:Nucleobase:cation symporter-1, NCS1 family n=1 Tax=Trinickia caryophylli TaxID=28094 RepID=A0A1X7G8S0_TRICW|nr:NCS1 family nucleobase:cation symporter-1 [Trinickia caryophylli]PMS11458.1 nitrate reductase [Trinickia caryophylli]TRX17657.1 NCS1 family nucleobase:cation symporter-1 [Trinickia caryophylli]WQE11584.1 NCS1 family nucleobase:cation symporter-1 [Trinickia caryophylli]SMF65215.1 nucleobase:cation symporter-1, NCS1 family [Trinickia caryophylli]GLU34760.1 nitrate reductase [Trinickia caryophylli]
MSSPSLIPPAAPQGAETPLAHDDSRLYNDDLAPVPHTRRTWTGYSIFAMWMSDVHSVGGYTFAASLFLLGISGWQVLLALAVGILVVYVLMNWVGKPSYVHGIPFPVMARVSMGVMGANLAAVIRGVVGIVWYGVQTYFASKAVATLLVLFIPSALSLRATSFLHLDGLGWISFLFMWLFQLIIFQRGMEAIRKFIDFCGPAVYVVMFALMAWILSKAGLSSLSLTLGGKTLSGGEQLIGMGNAVLLVVSYFAALLLNFGDFSRFARSERQMKVGNFLGLPVNFIVFAIVTVIVTSGSAQVFGQMIMDPVAIVGRLDNKFAVVVGSLTFIVATMGINIVANFVSPAYDISNLFPRHVDFKRGGLIASVLAVLVCPWIFVDSPKAITIFVSVFGAVLAPLYGVMMADFYLVKKQKVEAAALYSMAPQGRFYYDGGWNRIGVAALALSGAISIGWEISTQLLHLLPENNLGWVIGALAGAVLYPAMMRAARRS